ncbi:Jas TPL-binding domain [Arabidopsis suecica]|uniref:Jas TPL-binding domain n=1 Tax=Arabidopsis suecica TaxID=45249 RepID=A0A8T1XWR4_ARASU|nr:Jas TPL-binding domain [Arabidopsis suecica]
MSYESKGFWVMKNNEHTSEDDSVYDHSTRDDSKRPHPWFVDSSRSEMFPNKKQAVQDPVGGLGKSNVGLPLWESSSVFQSVSNQFMDRLLGAEMPPRPLLFGDRDRTEGCSHNHQTKSIAESYMEDTSVELSISNGVEVAGSSFGGDGIRKLPVSRVKETMSTHVTLDDHNQRKIESSSIQACSRENESSFINFELAGHPYGNEDSHGITFGEINDEHGVGSTSNVVGNYQSYVQDPIGTLDIVYGQETGSSQTSSGVVSEQQVAKPSLEPVPKNKAEAKSSKKEASTSFPSNVRSLISTGMLDGVPVTYVSISREELRGVIKGSGYLCGCQTCDFTKVLNAYAFERHAGCKTKHPNNHIYFENGKTIYQIVQELRNTPESILFDVIQTVFGSPINQKAFRIWKESFQAATRELQRIYGKEERSF